MGLAEQSQAKHTPDHAQVRGLTWGADQHLWLSENDSGPDGHLWVTETCANAIARVTVTGQVTEYPLSATEHGSGSYCLESP